MMELFLIIVGAVFVGYILATIALCVLMLNKYVQKFIMKYAFKMTMDMYELIENEPMFEEKNEA